MGAVTPHTHVHITHTEGVTPAHTYVHITYTGVSPPHTHMYTLHRQWGVLSGVRDKGEQQPYPVFLQKVNQ